MSPLAAIRGEGRALWRDGKGPTLVAIAGTWGILLGTRMVYPVLLPYFRESFGLSLSVAGVLVTVLWLGSALGQLPGGLLADRYSERSVMTAGVVVTALAVVGVVIAPTAVALFAATALVGVGQSLYPIARITVLTGMYPDRVGSALGVTMATGDLGQTVLPPVAAAIAAALAWQAGLGFLAPLLLVAAVVLWFRMPTDPDASSGFTALSVDVVRDLIDEFRGSNLSFFAFILFLYILVWQAFTGFYPTYLIERKGLSSSTAALLFSAFFAIGVIVKPAAGAAYDRVGARTALVIVLSAPVIGLVALPFVESVAALVVVTALVSTMLGSGAITQAFLSEAFPEEIRGTGLGTVRTAVATLGAAGPVLFGVVADRGYFDEGYLLLAAILLAVILLTLRLSEE